MATPMFRDLSRALEAPEEGRELWSGVPADEEPAYAEELFRKASDAALARENALPKEGYVPAGTGPVVEPSLDSTMAPMPSGLRSRKPVDFTPDTTKLQGKLAGFLGGDRSLVSPIPTANAPSNANAVAATTGAFAPTGPQNPAGTPDSMGKGGMVTPSSEGAGSDALGRLSLGQALTRALEGSGSIIAGRDLRSGAADTLGERMKQIEALRAKREEQSLEQQRERATWGSSNRATLASALAQWKGDEAKTAALEALASGADTTKPGDFSRNVVNAVMTKPKVLGAEAGVTKTEAQADAAKQAPGFKEREVKVKEGTLEERKRAAQANEELRRKALLAKRLSDTKANNDVRAAGSDPKAAEKAITRAMETAESDKLGIVGNIRDFEGLEKVAPGFTRGTVPSWLGQGGIEAARKVPALNKQATQLSSALETFIAGIRKSLFGASLTGNEKASFDAIVSSGLLMPPEVLAANINRLREGAAKFAQNHFTVAQELHPEVTGRVLRASTLFGPAVREGGIYSDVWTLPVGPAAGPSESQIAKLRANPDKASDFDAKFGPGAAAKILGGQ